MEYIIFNNEILQRSEAKVDIEDRGYQFGDGVYEVIRVYNGKMFTANEHLQRLVESTEKIGMNMPYSIEELTNVLEKLIETNKLSLGIVYMQITRGVAPRNHAYPNVPPSFVAYTKEFPIPTDNLENGVKVAVVEDVRWLRCDIKSLNLLGNVMAKQQAVEAGCFEAILHRDSVITEGSASNLFIVKNGVLKTHPANNLILNGITRQKVIELCEKNDIRFEEKAILLQDLVEASEVFLTSTTSEVMPIIEVDGNKIEGGKPGTLTRKLQDLFKKVIQEQCG